MTHRHCAKQALQYPPVQFTGPQANAIANGFAQQAARSDHRIHACAILPDHAHLVVGRHRYRIEQVTNLLKGAATRELTRRGLHLLGEHRTPRGNAPSPWAEGLWKVYLNSPSAVERASRYVQENPVRAGYRAQRWRFVVPYEG